MSFQDVAFLPPELVFTPHFLKIMAAVIASGRPHVLRQLLVLPPCNIFSLQQIKFFVSVNFIEITKLSQR